MTTLRGGLLAGICTALAFGGESVPSRTTLVVKADAHSGRLVRSVVVAPKVISPLSSEPEALETQSAAPITGDLLTGDLRDIIDAIAAKHDVEGPLVHSVIQAESNYNPLALSPKGAQGLMQLIPSTARRFGVQNSFNAQQNIEGGVKYLKFLMELYHNDYVKVIAAYNAGEGAVAKYGGIPPYTETRNYVQQVGRNLMSARKVADGKAAEATKEAKKKAATALETASEEPIFRQIVAVTGPDGKVYYKTQ